mmetsp:Transcript_2760/g.6730  ORF Transcript_2760/g.6730 Transcript_2760/m.6730 type:complete len:529 (-) Transcript_2760:24-1610(-)
MPNRGGLLEDEKLPVFVEGTARQLLERLLQPGACGSPFITAQLQAADASFCLLAISVSQFLEGPTVGCVRDAAGRTPVHVAARTGQADILRKLLEDVTRAGPHVGSWWRDAAERTPMHDAVLSGSWPCVQAVWEWCTWRDDDRVLLEVDTMGNTPMHYCDNWEIWTEMRQQIGDSAVWELRNFIGLVPSESTGRRLATLQRCLNFRTMPDCKAFDFIELGLSVHNTLVQYAAGDEQKGCQFGELLIPLGGARYEAVGLCVEPNPDCLPHLPKPTNVIYEVAAVGPEDGRRVLHRLPQSKLHEVKRKAPQLAEMTIALSTLDENGGGLRWHLEKAGFTPLQIDALVEPLEVEVLTLRALFQKHAVGSIGALQIDVEGQDSSVLWQLIALCKEHDELWPRALMFESDYDGSNAEEFENLEAELRANGFHFVHRPYTRRTRDRVFVRYRATRDDGEVRRTGPVCCRFLSGSCDDDQGCPFWHLGREQAGGVPCSLVGRRHQCWRQAGAGQRGQQAHALPSVPADGVLNPGG